MLEITEDVAEGTSIVSFETFEFLPVSGTNLDSAGQVRIRVENSDNFYYFYYSIKNYPGQQCTDVSLGLYQI